MTLASVIVPAYNVERWLPTCMDSILRQSHSDLEVILINDGSSDCTGDISDRFAKQDSRVHVVHQENRGLSAVRNRGIRLANGDLIFLVDTDDWVHPDFIKDVVEVFEERSPDVVMFQCAKYYERTGAWSGGTDDFYWNRLCHPGAAFTAPACDPQVLALYPLAQLKAISREYLKKKELQFIEGLKYEDNPFHVSLIAGYPHVALLPKRYYAWRQGRPGQITSTGHPDDALTALESMASLGFGMDAEYHPYLLVGMTRLAASVARSVDNIRDRRCFLEAVVTTIAKKTTDSALESAFEHLACLPVHLGDQLLTRCLFYSPSSLTAVLGNGMSKHLGSMQTIVNALRKNNGGFEVRVLRQIFNEFQSLAPYSRGVGDKGISYEKNCSDRTTAYVWNG